MRARDFATITIRLLAVASAALGIAMVTSAWLMNLTVRQFQSNVHDTWYIIGPTYYASLVPGTTALLVACALILSSRIIASLLVRDISE